MSWSDGTPIDASTFAYSINRSLDPCTASPVAYYLSGTNAELLKGSVAFNNGACPPDQEVSAKSLIGKSILAPDPLTLTLILSHPAAYFPAALSYPTAWAQPKQLIECYDPEVLPGGGRASNGWTNHLTDNGGFGGNLFKVTCWDHAGHIQLMRKERFWGVKPRLREIDWTLYEDKNMLWADYQRGRGDTGVPAPSAMAAARKLPGFQRAPDLTMYYLTPNWAIPPFDDLRVRQALFLALDRSALARDNKDLQDVIPSQPTIHIVPTGMPGYDAALADPAGRTGKDALTADVTRARAIWLAYVEDKCSGDASKCLPIIISTHASPALMARADAYVAMWQAALPGIQVQIDNREIDYVRRGQFVALDFAHWAADYPDPQDFASLLFHTGSAYNQSNVTLPAADMLLDQADAAQDAATRMRLYQQAEQLLIANVAAIPLYQSLNTYLVRPSVAGDYRERQESIAALGDWQRVYMVG